MVDKQTQSKYKLFNNWKKTEILWLFAATGTILALSIYWEDTVFGMITAVSGVVCSILTAKGKVSSYAWGILNCELYAYIAFQNMYYGEFILNAFYFTPVQIVGIFTWKKHLDKNTDTVESRTMSFKNRVYLANISIICVIAYGAWLNTLNGNLPYIDAIANTLNIIAMILLIKRFTEQWVLFLIVDMLSVGMWVYALTQGSTNVSILLMWLICLGNDIWGYIKWKNESKQVV